MPQYNHRETEQKWRKRWAETKLYQTDLGAGAKQAGLYRTDLGSSVEKVQDRPKYYNLVMFPYPSGDKLHIGHWYNYGPADTWGRYMRMKGFNVFQPMGYDAFGLPAENHAIKTGIHPDESTRKNTATMTEQLGRIGTMYDWEKTLDTSRPEYYRWTQWLFLQMFKNGLAYKKVASVNFCPNDQTVLANEQAQDGTCERCGAQVIQKPLNQWFWKITSYAQRLIDGLDTLAWPEKTKLMQRNWIGRSEGAEVRFEIEGSKEVITVFTTRVDTLFSAAFVVLAPEHPLVDTITAESEKKSVIKYREQAAKKTELQRTDLAKEKTGIFTGAFAVNPANGEKIPVWVADFVLAQYGHGAVFGDAHDERDFEFAKKYKISLKTTIQPADGSDDADIRSLKVCFGDDGILYDSGDFSGLTSAEARKKIAAWLGEKEKGNPVVNFRLRDWLLSRQRYWGAPIPIVYDPDGKPHPVPEEHLPWLLPTDVEFKPKGESPLTYSKEFAARTEKIFGKGWTPEYDTMDTFVCSSFYYLRYLMTGAEGGEKNFVEPRMEKKWMPVDMYIGGPEHACMHLIYARFVMMVLKDFGFVSHDEPFQRLVHQGLITNKGVKMSKSKGNVVSPDDFVDTYGSDVFRMYLMFMGPFTEGGDWSDKGITGVARFVERFYLLMSSDGKSGEEKVTDEPAMKRNLHATIKRVTEDMKKMQFNTAIAALMEFVNGCHKTGINREAKKLATMLISPLAPHLAEELWEIMGEKFSIVDQPWPGYDPSFLVTDTMTLAVQVNGKVRGELEVATGIQEDEIFAQASIIENVARHMEGKTPVKKIYVPGKLVSFVVK
ncbi:MAG TPA: leucine--tRNA ligase [Candidatus Gracilibacteria bacterium]|nr:leucine--tRNA ligase [Candidatus Gracilibacteria bacterium]